MEEICNFLLLGTANIFNLTIHCRFKKTVIQPWLNKKEGLDYQALLVLVFICLTLLSTTY